MVFVLGAQIKGEHGETVDNGSPQGIWWQCQGRGLACTDESGWGTVCSTPQGTGSVGSLKYHFKKGDDTPGLMPQWGGPMKSGVGRS